MPAPFPPLAAVVDLQICKLKRIDLGPLYTQKWSLCSVFSQLQNDTV
jgi:hypothetical protein